MAVRKNNDIENLNMKNTKSVESHLDVIEFEIPKRVKTYVKEVPADEAVPGRKSNEEKMAILKGENYRNAVRAKPKKYRIGISFTDPELYEALTDFKNLNNLDYNEIILPLLYDFLDVERKD